MYLGRDVSRKVHSGHADVHETEQEKECAQDVKWKQCHKVGHGIYNYSATREWRQSGEKAAQRLWGATGRAEDVESHVTSRRVAARASSECEKSSTQRSQLLHRLLAPLHRDLNQQPPLACFAVIAVISRVLCHGKMPSRF